MKQRRGNYHNPIFTLRIFPGISHANRDSLITAKTGWKYPNMWKSVNTRSRFEDRRILMSLTRFDQVWPKFDWSHGWSSSRFDRLFYHHLEEHMKIFSLIFHKLKMDLKRMSYGQNSGKRPNPLWNFAKYIGHKRPIFEAAFVCRVFSIRFMNF